MTNIIWQILEEFRAEYIKLTIEEIWQRFVPAKGGLVEVLFDTGRRQFWLKKKGSVNQANPFLEMVSNWDKW